MTILLREDLEKEIANGSIQFTGLIRKNSFVLSLGDQIQFVTEEPQIIDPYLNDTQDSLYGEAISNWRQTYLQSKQFVLISSAEFIKLDFHHHAFISTLSHVARLGIMSHATSSYVDPCFEGHITLEIFNLTPHTFILRQGMPIAKLVIFKSIGLYSNNSMQQVNYYGNSNSLRSKFAHEFSLPTKGENDECV